MRIPVFFRCFFCLALACLVLALPALADTVDLSSMSDDEIVALLGSVNDEMVRRGISKTAALPKGSYIAGKDLPAGRYIFTCKATGDDWGNVTVKSDGGAGDLIIWEVVSAPDDGEEAETIFITLTQGDELKSGVPFTLTIMSGAIFK